MKKACTGSATIIGCTEECCNTVQEHSEQHS